MDLVKALTFEEKRFLKNTPQRDWPWTISWLLWKRGKSFTSVSHELATKNGFEAGFAKATAILLQAASSAPKPGESTPASDIVLGDDHGLDAGGRAGPL